MPLNEHGEWIRDTSIQELYLYTNSESYSQGEMIEFCASSTFDNTDIEIEIIQDGPIPRTMHKSNATSKVGYHSAYQAYKGLNWPIVYKFEVPSSFPSGFYIVKGKTLDTHKAIAEHYFIVRPSRVSSNKNSNSKKDRILLILSTNTWNCYNQFGGASAYESKEVSEISKSWIGDPNGGLDIPFHELFRGTPMLSWKRPIIPGIISVKKYAPRITNIASRGEYNYPIPNDKKEMLIKDATDSYFNMFNATGWAMYERIFYVWALTHGNDYKIDIASNRDLHRFGTDLLSQYNVVTCVGHDEYWSSEMRDAMDTWLINGGRCARFAGNFMWQVRFEKHEGMNGGEDIQVCYKYGCVKNDPVFKTDNQDKLTFCWDSKLVGRPGCTTFGLNTSQGLYARFGKCSPRNSGGYTVYRNEHWSFQNSYVYYGDVLGGAGSGAIIFGYEADGLDYNFIDGLPVPTGKDGCETENTKIIAMGMCDNGGMPGDQRAIAAMRYGSKNINESPDEGMSDKDFKKGQRGNGMIVEYRKGKGCVYHAGCTEWVAGLAPKGTFTLSDDVNKNTEASTIAGEVTRTVLDTFLSEAELPSFDQDVSNRGSVSSKL
eukprot:g10463.t1